MLDNQQIEQERSKKKMQSLLILDESSDGRINIVVVVLWVVAYSTLHTT